MTQIPPLSPPDVTSRRVDGRRVPLGEVAAIGESTRVLGFALAGARVYPADDVDQALAAWKALPAGVEVVILTAAAAQALAEERTAPHAPLSVVTPP